MDPLVQALLARAMKQDNGMGGLEQELASHEAMGPEAYKEFINSNTFGERGQAARQGTQDQMGLLAQQYAQAQSLSQPKGKNFGTVGGNVASGLGDALGAFAGGMQMRNLGGQQKELLDQGQATQAGLLDRMDQSNNAAGNARFDAMRAFMANQQGPQAPPGQAGAPAQAPGGAANFGMAQLRNPLLGLIGA